MLFLLLFGLILSIPFVVCMSTLLAKLMDRYPIILWIGAALLGKVGGEMMATDPFIVELLQLPHWAEYASMAFFVAFVCGLSKWIINRKKVKCATEHPHGSDADVAAEGGHSNGGK
jgi:predicted tellurium resistance membrane protein TerC